DLPLKIEAKRGRREKVRRREKVQRGEWFNGARFRRGTIDGGSDRRFGETGSATRLVRRRDWFFSSICKKSQSAVDNALANSECYGLAGSDVRMSCFINKALVNVGGELAKVVSGRVSTEVDACLAYDTHSIVRKGIEASRVLESEGIQTHLTFVYRCIVVEACSSNIAFVGHSKVPNSTDGQVCLDAELNGQNYVNLDIENANAYPPCLVDINIEKGNSETPKTLMKMWKN
ncbi:hypothetical protein HYC85_013324, partial [Camellia sinensis]